MTALPPTVAGAVYDRGYRPYEGPRGGRRETTFALWRLSVRRALGIRRSWRQKVFPWSLLAIATIPAVVNVGVAWAIRNNPVELEDFSFITYRDYVGVSTALLLFVALTAPDVVCPDRAQRVLPLLFSRPLTGVDYVVAKVGAIAFIVFGFSFLPQVVLFLGQMLVSKDGALTYFTDNAEVLWQVPISVALLAIFYAAIGVALASLTERRIVGGVAILGVAFVTTAVAGIVISAAGGEGTPLAFISVFFLPLDLRDLVFLGHLDPDDSGFSGVAGGGLMAVVWYGVFLIAAISLLLYRYRQVDL